MNEKELGDALLKWDARGPAPEVDPHSVLASVLARDRRRVRRVAIGAIALWSLAALGIPLYSYFLIEFIVPKYNWLMHQIISPPENPDTRQLLETSDLLTAVTAKMGIVLSCGSIAILLLAAGCTIWLVFISRRSTLREVNANLAQISEQLKRLQPAGDQR